MTGNNDNAKASATVLQEAVAMVLRIAGTVAGAVSLIFAVGFVIVNLSLLKHGVYEGALLRERYVAAGISFILLLAGAATIALAAHEVSARLLGRPTRYFHLLLTVALVVGAYYVLAVAAWGLKEYRAFSQSLLVWILASGCLVLLFLYSASISRLLSFLHKLYAASISRIQSFLRRVRLLPAPDQSPPDAPQAPKSPPENGDVEPPQAAKSPLEKGEAENAVAQLRKRLETPSTLTVLGILLFVLLIIYGGYVYDTLPAALGGGLPVVVQFAGDEAKIAILAEMGVPLENPSTTGQLEFIGQTENRYYIFVREINWEESPTTGKIRVISRRTALAFDKELVLGVRYYPSEYHLSDDFAAVTHVQQGDELAAQEFYDGAIDEYTEALDRRPDFHLAFFRRGQAYLIKALNTSDRTSAWTWLDWAWTTWGRRAN